MKLVKIVKKKDEFDFKGFLLKCDQLRKRIGKPSDGYIEVEFKPMGEKSFSVLFTCAWTGNLNGGESDLVGHIRDAEKYVKNLKEARVYAEAQIKMLEKDFGAKYKQQ